MTNIFSIQSLSKVFVANNSVIIDKKSILPQSCVTKEVYAKYQKPQFLLKYFFPIFTFSQKQHILITDEWSKNYCHWLWEALSKLVKLKKQFPEAVLVLPKSYLKIDFVVKSLAAFGFDNKNIKIIPKRSRLKLQKLSFIPCINISTEGYYDFLKFEEVAQTIIEHYKDELKTNYGERIYISRSDPNKNTARKVANEKELTNMLEKYGFKTVYMENFSFLEQVSIMHFAKFIVAPHGAGITNASFAQKNCQLIELINKEWGKTCFAEMCDRTSINCHRFDCDQIDEKATIHLGDIKVDISLLEKKLIDKLN
jgi:capsular polysaccharide biosynthesis protein